MSSTRHIWSIVLAAGEGMRLRELTGSGNHAVPKQFCSLRGGRSLLQDALERAGRLSARKRIVVVVAEEHRAHWSRQLAGLPPENIVIQPANRGTASGILLPLLAVLERDPGARVLCLPSDHYVEREAVLERALRVALEGLAEPGAGLTLFGIVPDQAESGYGWIVPAPGRELLRGVASFVEKPAPAEAQLLFAGGALWNSFLMAGTGAALLALFERSHPELLARLRAAHGAHAGRAQRLEELYGCLRSCDFSRELLVGNEDVLRLALVPACGWTDLGTPARVAACLGALATARRRRHRAAGVALDLAQALERWRGRAEPPVPVAV